MPYGTRWKNWALLLPSITVFILQVKNHTPSVMLIIGYAIFIFLVCPAIVIWKDCESQAAGSGLTCFPADIEPTRKTKVERLRREQEEEE